MLKVYYGSDTNEVRHAALAAANAASSEPPFILSSEAYEPGQLAELVGGSSLFGEVRVIVIDTPVDGLAEEATALLADMSAATDAFIVIEGPLLAAAKKRYAKHADEVYEYTGPKAERFNTFALADALAARNKKQLWLLLQQATAAGISPEEIIGVLWWQLKSIRLAALSKNAAAAGMKDFPYNKAKRALGTIPLPEAERLSHEVLQMYHAGHAGETDLGLALEQWVLTL